MPKDKDETLKVTQRQAVAARKNERRENNDQTTDSSDEFDDEFDGDIDIGDVGDDDRDGDDSPGDVFPVVQPVVDKRRKSGPRKPAPVVSLAERNKILQGERKRRALELRKAGASYDQIADQMQVQRNTVSKWLREALAELTLEPAEDLRRLQIERLNHMLMALWPQVSGGNVNAISMAERLIGRMNALTGVEAPIKVQSSHQHGVLVIEGDQDSYIEALKRMSGVLPEEERLAMLGESAIEVTEAQVIPDDEVMLVVEATPIRIYEDEGPNERSKPRSKKRDWSTSPNVDDDDDK